VPALTNVFGLGPVLHNVFGLGPVLTIEVYSAPGLGVPSAQEPCWKHRRRQHEGASTRECVWVGQVFSILDPSTESISPQLM